MEVELQASFCISEPGFELKEISSDFIMLAYPCMKSGNITVLKTLLLNVDVLFQSVITLRFRDETNIENASKSWYYWSTRQADASPKAIELGKISKFQLDIVYQFHLSKN